MTHPLGHRWVALFSLLLTVVLAAPVSSDAARVETAKKWETTVFASIPSPGRAAYVLKHRNGRVYAGNYENPGNKQPSRVFEWSADGTLLRSWKVPGQVIGGHGVQVAEQTRDGKLVLLETSTRTVQLLNVRTGRFRRVATFPTGALPNFATWLPGGQLVVTDYAKNVLWKVDRRGTVTRWFSSPLLRGVASFGTTGIAYRPDQRDLLIGQQTITDGSMLPTNGALLRLPVASGKPGVAKVWWKSGVADLPDGFGIGRSGHVYVAMAGLSAQLAELDASGRELGRFPKAPLSGANGSPIPFDTASSATFHVTSVLVANQSAIMGDVSHQAILRVEVGERGRASYLPKKATFLRR